MKDRTGQTIDVGDRVSIRVSSFSEERREGIIESISIHDCQAINCSEQGKQIAVIKGSKRYWYPEELIKID